MPSAPGELYEGFGSDYSELRGHCILIPKSQNFNSISKTDDIIKQLNPMISSEFTQSQTFEQKIAILFNLKEKWTLGELELYLKDTLEPE